MDSREFNKNLSSKSENAGSPDSSQIVQNVDEYSAGFIIFRTEEGKDREYLILHYPGGHFDFPKGHLEPGETARIAAVRELEEETGITDIEVIEEFEEKIQYTFRRAGKLILKQVNFFLAETTKEQIKISHEHQGSLWLPFDAAMEKVTFDNAKQILKKAEAKLQSLK